MSLSEIWIWSPTTKTKELSKDIRGETVVLPKAVSKKLGEKVTAGAVLSSWGVDDHEKGGGSE